MSRIFCPLAVQETLKINAYLDDLTRNSQAVAVFEFYLATRPLQLNFYLNITIVFQAAIRAKNPSLSAFIYKWPFTFGRSSVQTNESRCQEKFQEPSKFTRPIPC